MAEFCLPLHAILRNPFRDRGSGHTSWVLAQRPSMGVMLNP